jgi:hypothetical protein
MNIIKFLILSLLLLNFACARPNYDDTGRNPASEQECSLNNAKLNFHFYWIHRPQSESEEGTFFLEFFDPSDPSHMLDPKESLSVSLWMADMGHGAPPVKVERQGLGQYNVSRAYFSMHGNWQIQVQLKNGAEIVDQVNVQERF